MMQSIGRGIFLAGAVVASALIFPTPASGQPTFDLTAPECVPSEDNAPVRGRLDGVPTGAEARLYFRRLNPLGAFYWVEMHADSNGEYWSVFPRPEDRRQQPLTEEWWALLADRDWVGDRDFDGMVEYFESQEHELVEYYVAVVDRAGEILGRSKTRLVEVQDPELCNPALSLRERAWAQNLTIGEMAGTQVGRPVFHWLCDGIVTRVSARGLWRADDFCRGCAVPGRIAPIAAGGDSAEESAEAP